jgi:hypothetical protein
MFLIVTRGGETRRIEIPLDVERDGTAEAWAATCAPDVWSAAEIVPASWPSFDGVVFVLAPVDASTDAVLDTPAPDPLILDEE